MESSQKRLTSLIELTIAGNAESICENLEGFSDEFCRLAETTEQTHVASLFSDYISDIAKRMFDRADIAMKAEATLKALDESRAEPQKEERKQQKGRSRDMDMDR